MNVETVKRVSKGGHEYAGHTLKVGEEFDLEVGHVEIALAAGRIEPEPGEEGYEAGLSKRQIRRKKTADLAAD